MDAWTSSASRWTVPTRQRLPAFGGEALRWSDVSVATNERAARRYRSLGYRDEDLRLTKVLTMNEADTSALCGDL
jgi:hypothetical protein